jgi:hypothetical protein
MAHQFFQDLKRHTGIEEVGGKRMPEAVRRIMTGEPSGREILIHQDIDLGSEEMWSMTFRTGEEIDA